MEFYVPGTRPTDPRSLSSSESAPAVVELISANLRLMSQEDLSILVDCAPSPKGGKPVSKTTTASGCLPATSSSSGPP